MDEEISCMRSQGKSDPTNGVRLEPMPPVALQTACNGTFTFSLRLKSPTSFKRTAFCSFYFVLHIPKGGGAQHQREEKLQLWLPPRLPVPDWKMVFLYTLSIQKLLLSARYRHLRVKKLCVDILYPHSELSFPPLPSSLCLLLPLAQSLQFLPGLLKAISGCKVYGFLPPRVSHLGISYFK